MNGIQVPGSNLVISYLVLRKAIGYLGITLPFILSCGNMIFEKMGVQSSISSYYYTPMRDVFVGTLYAISVFMMSYKGYSRKDSITGNLACLFGVGVALFPTKPDVDPTSLQVIIGHIHLIFAALFFLPLLTFHYSYSLKQIYQRSQHLENFKGILSIGFVDG